jgi:PadR family transcriptional regulator, regulatory protein PadR
MIRKSPVSALVIFLSLSLGVAAATTIFSVLYRVLLAPSLYTDTSRLAVLWESNPMKGMMRTPVAPATFRDWLNKSHSFVERSFSCLTSLARLFYSWLWEKMRRHSNDRLKGTLDLLVLKVLASQGKMHGFGITLRIEQISESMLRLEEGSLYPALHRMTQAGWLRSEWGLSESNRRARYYVITTAGRRQLAEESREWSQLTEAVARVLSLA